jgi:hypothetical protein
LGWTQIIHPFHPFRGQQFLILKTRRVSGVDTLILRGSTSGTFGVPRAWTDRAWPPPPELPTVVCALDGLGLRQLADLIDQLNHDANKGLDK